MAKQSLASILAAKRKPQKFADGGLDADTKTMLASNPLNPQFGLGPVFQVNNNGSSGQGQPLSQNMTGILTAGNNQAAPAPTAGNWGNVQQLPAYSQGAQQQAFNLNLAPEQQQINQGYNAAGQTAQNAATFTQALQNQALGNGPSLATAQLQQAQNQTLAQQLGAAAAARGGNAAANQRSLMQNQALSGQQLGQQAAITQIQNQQSLANTATNAQNAQTQQQALQQSFINQGMTADQAQQAASSSYMNYVTEQQQSAAAQQAAIQAAQLGANASVTSANIGASGNTLWHYLGLKDGGPVEVQKPSSFASTISKQIYPRIDSMPSFAKRAVHAADGNAGMGIQPIASLSSAQQQQMNKPTVQQNPAIANVTPHESSSSNPGVSPVLNSAKAVAGLYAASPATTTELDPFGVSQNAGIFNAGYDSTAAAGAGAEAGAGGEGLAALLAANGGAMYRHKFDDGGQAMLGSNYSAPLTPQVEETDLQVGKSGGVGGASQGNGDPTGGLLQTGLGLAAAPIAIGAGIIGGVASAIGDLFADGGAVGGDQYAPSEQELRIARNLTRDVLVPQFANGGVAKPIWRGPGIPETSESVADIGTGIQKPIWRGPGIPETFESSYGSVLAARRQLKK